MPRTFALSAQYHASVEQVYATFADTRYWLARLADSGADTATLDSMTVGTVGIDVTTVQRLRRDRLPALVAQFHPGDLEVIRVEEWHPVHDGEARAVITGRVTGAPARVSGEAALTPGRSGCTLSVDLRVQVDIPLVGGKVETFIGGQLAALIAAEQRFTSEWIAEAGGTAAR